ncbi:MAG: hypothetical protein ABJQ69_03480 [Ekhidna sp.]
MESLVELKKEELQEIDGGLPVLMAFTGIGIIAFTAGFLYQKYQQSN